MKKKITAFIMSVCLVAAMIADPVQAASKKAYIKTGVSSKVTVLCGKTVNLKAKTVNKKKKITDNLLNDFLLFSYYPLLLIL